MKTPNLSVIDNQKKVPKLTCKNLFFFVTLPNIILETLFGCDWCDLKLNLNILGIALQLKFYVKHPWSCSAGEVWL